MHRLCLLLLPLLTACNGIFEDIYDKPSDQVDEGLPYGYKALEADRKGGTLFFNSTSYTRWTYFNLREVKSDTLDFPKNVTPEGLAAMEPEDWDIAMHRSVPKTNGGSVAETRYETVAALDEACFKAGGVEAMMAGEGLVLTADVWGTEQVALDLSQMFSGIVQYLPSFYNPVLNGWLDIDISNPPPIYTPSNRAYLLKLRTGEYYALKLVHFRNSKNITSWLTIDFKRLAE